MEANTAAGPGFRNPDVDVVENTRLVDVDTVLLGPGTVRGTLWEVVGIVVRGSGTVAGILDTVVRDLDRILLATVVCDPANIQ